jgi:hypothetical protein
MLNLSPGDGIAFGTLIATVGAFGIKWLSIKRPNNGKVVSVESFMANNVFMEKCFSLLDARMGRIENSQQRIEELIMKKFIERTTN